MAKKLTKSTVTLGPHQLFFSFFSRGEGGSQYYPQALTSRKLAVKKLKVLSQNVGRDDIIIALKLKKKLSARTKEEGEAKKHQSVCRHCSPLQVPGSQMILIMIQIISCLVARCSFTCNNYTFSALPYHGDSLLSLAGNLLEPAAKSLQRLQPALIQA